MSSLKGKVAIVTGSSRGIGLAIARKFIEEEAKVIMTDIADEGEARAAELGANATFIRHDVTSAGRWSEVVAQGVAHFGDVSVLVNNAGISDFNAIDDCSEDRYRRLVEVNQMSVFLGMKAVIAVMRKAGGGSIINTSSTAGLFGAPASIGYVASKFAVTGMTKAAALDLGKFGIRVNSVHPGPVATAMMAEARAGGIDIEPALRGLPIGRAAQPVELAGVYAFLASDAASYCTGSCFTVDGGLTAA
jgi:3alpha(or 20beta)-hydroxysteroid dehydrogenase